MNSIKTKIVTAMAIIAVFVSLAVVVYPKPVSADQYDDQIAALKKQVQQNLDAANQKHSEADTLKNKIGELDAQIAAAQAALNLTGAQIGQTNAQIDAAQKDLDRQKSILKENLRQIYKQGEISPLEVVASSKNLSDFVANQEYLNAIKKKVDDNLLKIDALQKELAGKKDQLTGLQTQQQAQRDQVASQKKQQADLLAQTQGDESKYQGVAADQNAKITELRKQQAAIIRSFSSNVQYGGSGGYPWAGVSFPNSEPDPWGMYKRQCVSYTAWKVASTGRHMPYWGGRGNASEWPGNARAAGIPVDGSPRPGDVAISMKGPYGHAMYVESVSGDKVHVSQYNANWDGNYSTSDINTGSAVYIHF